MIKIGIQAQEVIQAALDNKTVFYESRFGFLKEIGGIRPGFTHCLMGISSAGKSTLLKAIIADTIKKEKVLVWLSEEEVKNYSKGVIDAHIGEMGASKKNILWFEESDEENEKEIENYKKNPKAAANFIIQQMILSEAKVVFFDNLTTSSLYSSFFPSAQEMIFRTIRSFCSKSGIAFFYLAHTQKEINQAINRLLFPEDVQGSSILAKGSELFFILQTFDIGNRKESFIQISKTRPIEGGVKNKFFNMCFNGVYYSSDKICQFEDLSESFRSRNKFSDKEKKKYGN